MSQTVSELAGSFFDEWSTFLSRFSTCEVEILLVGHSLGAAVASHLYYVLHDCFKRWRFTVVTFAPVSFATEHQLECMASSHQRLKLWVSIANEGTVGGKFKDVLLHYSGQQQGQHQFTWHTYNRQKYAFSSVHFTCNLDDVWDVDILDKKRIFVVNSSVLVDENVIDLIEPDDSLSLDGQDRALVAWAAHCLFQFQASVVVL